VREINVNVEQRGSFNGTGKHADMAKSEKILAIEDERKSCKQRWE